MEDCGTLDALLPCITLYTSQTKSVRATEGDERRLRTLLDAKRVPYRVVYVDCRSISSSNSNANASTTNSTEAASNSSSNAVRSNMVAVSGTSSLPQLHIWGHYYGGMAKLQELEDMSLLDPLLAVKCHYDSHHVCGAVELGDNLQERYRNISDGEELSGAQGGSYSTLHFFSSIYICFSFLLF